ncbi:MAG: CBS domain-containing protein [Burkholderiales bacterium]|nr:CBS domain-containing protein [Burkholderiales bacterium]
MLTHTVGDVVASKKLQEIVSVPAAATAAEAAALMSEKEIGAVVVRGAGGAIEGIFTERDVLRRIVADGRDPKATRIAEVMSRNVRSVASTLTVAEALQQMVMYRYRHLLVQDGAEVKGLVSIRDLMVWFIMPDTPMAHEGRYGHILSRTQEAVRAMQSIKPGSGPRS